MSNRTNIQVNIGLSGYASIYTSKVLLPKNGTLLTQDMVLEPNTKYIVKHILNLNRQTIQMPYNCVIEIDGGQLYNGTLVGNDTILINTNGVNSITKDLVQTGTWIYPEGSIAGPPGPPGQSFTYEDLTESQKQEFIDKIYNKVIDDYIIYPDLYTTPTELPYRFGDNTVYQLLIPAIDNNKILGNFYDVDEEYFNLDNLPINCVILEAFVFNKTRQESAQCIKINNKWEINSSNSDFSPDYALVRYYLEN